MDPGTGLGVASLGLEVSKILLEFYVDYQSQDDDIAEVYRSTKRLNHLFEQCLRILQKTSGHSAARKSVDECLADCQDDVKDLQAMAKKFTADPKPTTVWEKVKYGGTKLKYPFRRGTVLQLKGTVSNTLYSLGVAIDLLQRDVAVDDLASLKSRTADLLQQVSMITINTNTIADRTQNMSKDLTTVLSIAQQQELDTALRWLNAPDPTANHKEARRKHETGTREWFLTSTEYKDWVAGDPGPLWLHGKPGWCKTVLSSTIIEGLEHLQSHQPCRVACFYFTFQDQAKQSWESLVRSLTAQLSFGQLLLPQLGAARAKNDRRLETVLSVLSELLARQQRTYIVIDALDECPEDHDARLELLNGISKLCQSHSNLQLLATSRDEVTIREAMYRLQAQVVCLSDKNINADILLFVDRRLASDLEFEPKKKRFLLTHKAVIRQAFEDKAHGMFRWAYCQLEAIKRARYLKKDGLTRTLAELPKGLDETYERIIALVGCHYQQDVRRALMWLAFSIEPLTVSELTDACITTTQEESFVDEESRDVMTNILDVLSSLLQVESVVDVENHRRAEIVQLAHFSIKEFLVAPRTKEGPASLFFLEEAECHSQLSQTCSAYVIHCYEQQKAEPAAEESNKPWVGWSHPFGTIYQESKTPLLDYSRQLGMSHQALAERSPNQASLPQLHWRLIQESGLQKFFHWKSDIVWPSLAFAAYWRLPLTCAIILERTKAPDVERIYSRSLSSSPPERLRRDTTLKRLNKTASALALAAATGHERILTLLLQHHADPNFSIAWRPVVAAIQRGHLKVVDLLLHHEGFDVNAACSDGTTPLHQAAKAGLADIFVNLIQRNAVVDTLDGRDNTPLMLACQYLKPSTVRLLIEAGADVGHKKRDGCTALHLAAIDPGDQRMFEEIAEMLIGKGAEIHALDCGGHTPLHIAARRPNEGAAKVLLGLGADVNCDNEYRCTPLMKAIAGALPASEASVGMVSFLIDSGADLEFQDAEGLTALHIACMLPSPRCVEILLSRNADPDKRQDGSSALTALDLACKARCPTSVELLLDHGVDIRPSITVSEERSTQRWSKFQEHFRLIEEEGYMRWRAIARSIVSRKARLVWYEVVDDKKVVQTRLQLTDDDGNEVSYDGGWESKLGGGDSLAQDEEDFGSLAHFRA